MKKIVIIMFAVLILASCGKKEVKQVSQESTQSQEAFALADTIRRAFINNDIVTIQNNSTAEGYRDITSGKKAFDSVELAFTPRWVEIEKNELSLNVSWKSTWTIAGKKSEDRGMAIFVMEGKPFKVSKILRANPFTYPEQ